MAKAKQNTNKMGRVMCKICRILSNVILQQFLFEIEKRSFEFWVWYKLKLKKADPPIDS